MVASTIAILALIWAGGFTFERGWQIQVIGCALLAWNWMLYIVLKEDRRRWTRR